MKKECDNPVEVAKEMFWLAWQACGGPLGRGFLQNNSGATRDEVWQNVMGAEDYPGGSHCQPGQANGDYVFGRMMKLRFNFGEDYVEFPNSEPHADYQAWCLQYPSYETLYEAAEKSLKGG